MPQSTYIYPVYISDPKIYFWTVVEHWAVVSLNPTDQKIVLHIIDVLEANSFSQFFFATETRTTAMQHHRVESGQKVSVDNSMAEKCPSIFEK